VSIPLIKRIVRKIRSFFKREQSETEQIIRNKPLMELIRRARKEGGRTKPYEPLIEEKTREEWLPEPTTKRRHVRSRGLPPAERHRDAISRHMKGKGRFSKHYRQTIKRSSKIKMEDD